MVKHTAGYRFGIWHCYLAYGYVSGTYAGGSRADQWLIRQLEIRYVADSFYRTYAGHDGARRRDG